MKKYPLISFFKEHCNNPWFWAFKVFAVVTFVVMPLMSKDAGNSGDEDRFQVPQGRNVLNYFDTDRQDTTCMTFENLKYYGSSPDVVAEYVNQTFEIEDYHTTRHVLFAWCGWLIMIFVGLMAFFITGSWRAALIAIFLAFISPRLLGHAFNNSKDIPFAAAITMAIFSIILFLKQFPKVKIYTLVLLIISVAFAISVRVGGLIVYGYLGFFAFIYLIIRIKNQQKMMKNGTFIAAISWNEVGRMLIYGTVVVLLSFTLGILLWPFALQAPIQHTWEAFVEMSDFSVSLRQLFEGELIWSDKLPWYYTPKYIFMTIPSSVIVGLILFFGLIWKKKENYFYYFILFFTFFFPVFWIIYSNANVYGGWRHAIFAYPTMVVAAAVGFELAINWLEMKFNHPLNLETEKYHNITRNENNKKTRVAKN